MVLSRVTGLSCALLIALAGSPGVTRGQIAEPVPQTEQLELTVQNIMKGPSLVGRAPSRLRWAWSWADEYRRIFELFEDNIGSAGAGIVSSDASGE